MVASEKRTGNSAPNSYNENDLRINLVNKVSKKSAKDIVSRLLASWDQETKNGIRYNVRFYNVRSYRKQGLVSDNF